MQRGNGRATWGHHRRPAELTLEHEKCMCLKGDISWALPLGRAALSIYLVEKFGHRCPVGVLLGWGDQENEGLWWSPEDVWPCFVFHEIQVLEGGGEKRDE